MVFEIFIKSVIWSLSKTICIFYLFFLGLDPPFCYFSCLINVFVENWTIYPICFRFLYQLPRPRSTTCGLVSVSLFLYVMPTSIISVSSISVGSLTPFSRGYSLGHAHNHVKFIWFFLNSLPIFCILLRKFEEFKY